MRVSHSTACGVLCACRSPIAEEHAQEVVEVMVESHLASVASGQQPGFSGRKCFDVAGPLTSKLDSFNTSKRLMFPSCKRRMFVSLPKSVLYIPVFSIKERNDELV